MIYLSLTGHLSLHPFAGIPCGYEVSGTDPFSQEDHAGYQQLDMMKACCFDI